MPEDSRLNRFFGVATLERGLLAGGLSFAGGIGLLAWMTQAAWKENGWGPLNYSSLDARGDTGGDDGGFGISDDIVEFLYLHPRNFAP